MLNEKQYLFCTSARALKMHGTKHPIANLFINMAKNAKEIMASRRKIVNQEILNSLMKGIK
jgi:hypothetical protein